MNGIYDAIETRVLDAALLNYIASGMISRYKYVVYGYWEKGRYLKKAVWQTPLNDRQCIGKMTQRRYETKLF